MADFYEYQKEDALQIERFGGRCLVASDPGTGKSRTVLLWAKRNPEVRPIVIVCPASVKWHWQRECLTVFGWRASVLEGRKPLSSGGLLSEHGIYIINYDILGSWLEFFRTVKVRLVVADEAHYLVNRRAQRTRHMKTMTRDVDHVIALSGTPLVSRPSELWPVLNIIRPRLFPSFWSFAESYCSPRRTNWGWDVSGSHDLPILHRYLTQNCMIRRLKKDVLKDLPPKSRVVMPLDIENRREYEKAKKDFLAWLRQKRPQAKGALRAQALMQIGYLKRLAAELKLGSIIDWIDDFFAESDEKLVIMAVHKKIIGALRERYANTCVVVDGDVTGIARQEAVDAFQSNSRVKLFLGNIKAAGVGITLTAASTMAFAEMDWTPGAHTQAEDRIHRISAVNNVTCFYLVARDTIEEKLVEIIQRKQKTLNEVLDGGEGDDLSIHDELLDALSEE